MKMCGISGILCLASLLIIRLTPGKYARCISLSHLIYYDWINVSDMHIFCMAGLFIESVRL